MLRILSFLYWPELQNSFLSRPITKNAKLMRRRVGKVSFCNGFSIIELLVVIGVLALLSAISLPYIVNYKARYKSEDQALKAIDLLRETGQLALTRRRTFRFEIDLTDNYLRLIDENGSGTDKLLKKIPLELIRDVRVDRIPQSVNKPNPPNFSDITFSIDTIGHQDGSTNVVGHSTWVARFRSDGSVVDKNNVLVNANIYFWPPQSPGSLTARSLGEVRAVTLAGGSGAIRYWKHNGTAFYAYQ